MKKALITGITGQDGSYLAELLIEKGYEVHGIKRRPSSLNTQRIEHIYQDVHNKDARLKLHYGDLSDTANIISLIQNIQPDEIYNLGAQSHVMVSFEMPEYTTDVNGLGTLRLLEAIRLLGLNNKTKFYQASTSELYGLCEDKLLNEDSRFCPQSPYACAKLYAYWITVNYRNAYNIFASNGILFNHESKRRGETFVTRKISQAAVKIKLGAEDKLFLGNLDAVRDWGHAKDYVYGMWKILQHDEADDFVLATGIVSTVRDFCKKVFACLDIDLCFKGSGYDEKGYDASTGKVLVEVDKRYFRPVDVNLLHGDFSKAREKLNWYPKYSLDDIIAEMVHNDYNEIKSKLESSNYYA